MLCVGARALCDCDTPTIIEKLRSTGVTMHVYGASAYLRINRKSTEWPYAKPFEKSIKIEQWLNFDDSRLFFDTQEA